MTAEKLKEALEMAQIWTDTRQSASGPVSANSVQLICQALIELNDEIEKAPIMYGRTCLDAGDGNGYLAYQSVQLGGQTHKAKLIRIELLKRPNGNK